MNTEGFIQLKRLLADLPDNQFDSRWFMNDDRDTKISTGCSLGWMVRDSWFKKQGWFLMKDYGQYPFLKYKNQRLFGISAAMVFFDIESEYAYKLFGDINGTMSRQDSINLIDKLLDV